MTGPGPMVVESGPGDTVGRFSSEVEARLMEGWVGGVGRVFRRILRGIVERVEGPGTGEGGPAYEGTRDGIRDRMETRNVYDEGDGRYEKEGPRRTSGE